MSPGGLFFSPSGGESQGLEDPKWVIHLHSTVEDYANSQEVSLFGSQNMYNLYCFLGQFIEFSPVYFLRFSSCPI